MAQTAKMELIRIPFERVLQFSKTDTAYVTGDPDLRPFYSFPYSIDGLEDAYKDRRKENTDRKTLVDVLKKQYRDSALLTKEVEERIDKLLSDNTFTVATAHQPSLFTGPLYFIYKAISVIVLSRVLNSAFPSAGIVPVMILGGEDHDLEEVNHLWLFDKKVEWKTGQEGPVGRMSLEGIKEAIGDAAGILGESERARELIDMLEEAYGDGYNYGTATLRFVHALLGKHGLLLLRMDQKELKANFRPHFERELFESPSEQIVLQTQKELDKLGFRAQAHPRPVNLFYIEKGLRARILKKDDHFLIQDTELSFSKKEMKELLENEPWKLSPNVITRPLYQEFTLPNLAYIGGGGELAYWLERKRQFELFGIPYPALIRRDSVLFIDKGNYKLARKLEINIPDLFEEIESLKKQFIKSHAEVTLDLSREKDQLQALFDGLGDRAGKIEEGLRKWVLAEGARQMKSLDHVEKRMIRAEKQAREVDINRIEKLKDNLFPDQGLQERKDNFMQYYLKYGDGFFDILLDKLNPLDKNMKVLIDS